MGIKSVDLALSQQESDAIIDENSNAITYHKAVVNAYRDYGDDSIAAYDYCKMIEFAGHGYQLGYYTEQETEDIYLEAAALLQSTYDNWDDFTASYLYGVQYFNQDDALDEDSYTYEYLQAYAAIRDQADSPYETIDYMSSFE